MNLMITTKLADCRPPYISQKCLFNGYDMIYMLHNFLMLLCSDNQVSMVIVDDLVLYGTRA